MWKPPRRVVIRLSNGVEIVTHDGSGEPRPPRAPETDAPAPEIEPPKAS